MTAREVKRQPGSPIGMNARNAIVTLFSYALMIAFAIAGLAIVTASLLSAG